jgi:GNAT superfamily N-acetyltransferase
MALIVRPATTDDIPTLSELIRASTRTLSKNDYTDEQIETALQRAMGVDSELIQDRTYFVVEAVTAAERQIVACGGWSRRVRLLGTDHGPVGESAYLDPSRDPARVRAFYVHPDWARRGIGRLLLAHCEAEARAHGFTAVELMATLPGQRLYEVCGYTAAEPVQYPLSETISMKLVPMRKTLAEEQQLAS